jgi:L-histidine Nalpha-methyltransferase
VQREAVDLRAHSLCSAAVTGQPLPSLAAADRPASAAQPAPDPAARIRADLAAPTASIAPRWFYDDLGSRLFRAITALPEYYPTRTEAALLQQHLQAIVAATALHRPTMIDLGAGDCEKAARLLDTVQPSTYVAVDISAAFLHEALAQLRRHHPGIDMLGVGADFAERLELPAAVPSERRLFFYPGSSIGNFTPPDAQRFLASVRAQMHGASALWIGVDLHKPREVLELAYDDPLGVTAAFNRNVLRHVNHLAGTDFDVSDWKHVAFYAERLGRIEMHLEALRPVTVRWPDGVRRFTTGERIHTENSYKHTVPGFRAMLGQAGLRTVEHWTDARGWFAFFLAVPDRAV